ncbi:hypothetical protein CCACVL1_17569, partial [Corchorus capsularis]
MVEPRERDALDNKAFIVAGSLMNLNTFIEVACTQTIFRVGLAPSKL